MGENKSKKDNIYDTIIDLRRDLESMKLHRHRRSSSNIKMKFGQEKKEKLNPFREWLRSEEIGMEEYFPLFVSEGIDSLAVASFLSEQDLIELGIVKYGHIKALCHKFKQHREGVEVIDVGC